MEIKATLKLVGIILFFLGILHYCSTFLLKLILKSYVIFLFTELTFVTDDGE